MPHHVEDGDNLAVSPVMLRQTVKVAVYVRGRSCYLEVISRNFRDYPELCSPNRTACNHNKRFHQKRE